MHVIIFIACRHPCLPAYILPSSPVLLHIIYCTCFSTIWHCHPYILQHLMEMFLLPCFTGFCFVISLANIQCSLHLCEPHPFCCLWSCEMHMGNYEEMTFNYMEVLVYRSFTCLRWALQRFPLVF